MAYKTVHFLNGSSVEISLDECKELIEGLKAEPTHVQVGTELDVKLFKVSQILWID